MKCAAISLIALALAGCATSYQSSGLAGGFSETRIADDVYRIGFGANGFSTRETAQTYWLYRATELALEKGFDGFEIVSLLNLGQAPANPHYQRAAFVYVPIYTDNSHKPYIQADVRLLRGPVEHNPPKVFDARTLQSALTPYVKGDKKCNSGNVCPHLKDYLQPKKTTDEPRARAVDA
ncbi:CC0125/CC1285 family lipoprotein [Piscinibacter sp.]|uniref:CC0125/CC1285 family lipoprotein n=1 Tax=Piscinibacter sp. TaxID=1903157 RepID=UPI002BD9B332|nr:hypothetical protein [Albitalea sp.]HUG21480.1 hypothetical protein [Albitalea sp.]